MLNNLNQVLAIIIMYCGIAQKSIKILTPLYELIK